MLGPGPWLIGVVFVVAPSFGPSPSGLHAHAVHVGRGVSTRRPVRWSAAIRARQARGLLGSGVEARERESLPLPTIQSRWRTRARAACPTIQKSNDGGDRRRPHLQAISNCTIATSSTRLNRLKGSPTAYAKRAHAIPRSR